MYIYILRERERRGYEVPNAVGVRERSSNKGGTRYSARGAGIIKYITTGIRFRAVVTDYDDDGDGFPRVRFGPLLCRDASRIL